MVVGNLSIPSWFQVLEGFKPGLLASSNSYHAQQFDKRPGIEFSLV